MTWWQTLIGFAVGGVIAQAGMLVGSHIAREQRRRDEAHRRSASGDDYRTDGS